MMENISSTKRLWFFTFKSTLLGAFIGSFIPVIAMFTWDGTPPKMEDILFFIFIGTMVGLIPAFPAALFVGWLAIYKNRSHYIYTIILCCILFLSYLIIYQINLSNLSAFDKNYPDEFQYRFAFVFALIFIPSLSCRYEFRRYLKNSETV